MNLERVGEGDELQPSCSLGDVVRSRLFKPFSRVRDVFLKSANESRNRGYAFVRFGTMKEIRKDDVFGSMKRWSSTIVPQPSPIWIKAYRIPMRLWNINFFKLLGKSLGEFPKVDNQSLSRRRLDKGRFLVCLLVGNSCLKNISVKEGNRSWTVFLEKDSSPVTNSWVEEILGMNQEASPDVSREFPFKEIKLHMREVMDEAMSTLKSLDGDKVGKFCENRGLGGLKWKGDKLEISKEVNKDLFQLRAEGKVGFEKSMGKGKIVYIKNSKRRPTAEECLNSKLVIGSREVVRKRRLYSRKDDSTSSDSKIEEANLLFWVNAIS
ncbi:hypothetical protein QYF36_000069 [Acer negundo]|nr:hypothetical protein QYF36_000069 [Acer negundo]